MECDVRAESTYSEPVTQCIQHRQILFILESTTIVVSRYTLQYSNETNHIQMNITIKKKFSSGEKH